MQEHAYEAMQNLQEHHWWWRGMRHLYRAALVRYVPDRPARRVIDVGCGFGANLSLLSTWGDVVGVDVEFEALQAIQHRPTLGLVQAQADALPFRAESFDVIALLGVIEHLDHDDQLLCETYRIARPGAIQILLTSAFMFLWSHHDEANNHRRRYRAKQIHALQKSAGWHVIATRYVNTAIFPAVFLVRLIQRRMRLPDNAAYDMGPNLGPLSRILEWLLKMEAWIVTRTRITLPFGVDIFSIGRRDD